MVAFRLLMYTLMGWIPVASIASATKGYSHSLDVLYFAVTPVIRRSARWWNSYRTFIIAPVTNQLSLPYSRTD